MFCNFNDFSSVCSLGSMLEERIGQLAVSSSHSQVVIPRYRQRSLLKTYKPRVKFTPSLPRILEDEELEIVEMSRGRSRSQNGEKLQTGPLPNVQRLLDATNKTTEEVAKALQIPPTDIQDLLVGSNFKYM